MTWINPVKSTVKMPVEVFSPPAGVQVGHGKFKVIPEQSYLIQVEIFKIPAKVNNFTIKVQNMSK